MFVDIDRPVKMTEMPDRPASLVCGEPAVASAGRTGVFSESLDARAGELAKWNSNTKGQSQASEEASSIGL